MSSKEPERVFKDIPVIGDLPEDKQISKLQELGERRTRFIGKPHIPVWKYTAHTFGYIGLIQAGNNNPMPIAHAGNIKANQDLKNSRINISLGALRVAEYPGSGIHNILFDFYAKNQLPTNQMEDLHFNQTYRVMQGQSAPIIGYPIFIGLSVGSQSVSFQCLTVNVKNDNDQAVLNFLDSNVFKDGLKLATTAQPAIAPLTGIAIGITKMIASRNNNVPVQNFFMGLDFTNTAYGARLAQGTYVAVQIPQDPQNPWDWTEWVYRPQIGIVNKSNNTDIPYNYIVINISKYDGN
jgi:hypothetical protein